METGLILFEERLTIKAILEQISFIQEIMKNVMKENEHYGIIPGASKPSLFKSGAEKLNLTFRMAPEFEGENSPKDLGNNHREYIIKCSLYSIRNHILFAEGVGSCSTLESKYRYRVGVTEPTGQKVPKEYWDNWKSNPEEAQKIIGGKGFQVKKNPDNNQWEIVKKGEKIEYDNPADYYNTILKMAKKRAMIDAVLTATAASDIFTQDIEDSQDENGKEKEKSMDQKETSNKEPQKEVEKYITESQRKRFYAIAKSTGASDESIKDWLYREFNLSSTKEINKADYEKICDQIKIDLGDERGME